LFGGIGLVLVIDKSDFEHDLTSIFRHHPPKVVGVEMHPAFEVEVAKLGFAA
jgi:hypothetical protein